MKVILQQDVKGQGKKGDLITVNDGYGRNFLIPRKLAIEATVDALNAIKQTEAAKLRKIEIEKKAALDLAEKLKSIPVKVQARSGSGGKLFGSVTSKEISENMLRQHGVEITKQKIVLDEPIKTFGTFEVKVKLYPEITGTIYVIVSEIKE